MGEPMDTIVANYTDEGEKNSVRAALVQVVGEIVGPHISLPGIDVVKNKLLLDVVQQMHAGGHVFSSVLRGGAVANSEAVIADNTAWFVDLYKNTEAAKIACRAMFGALKGDPAGGGGAAGGGTMGVNAMAAAAAAAAVKANQLPTAEDKVKQGKGQQVRNSQLDIDMENPRVLAAVQTVTSDAKIVEGTEESYAALCQCHAAIRQSLYMEIKEQTRGTVAHRLHQEREAMMARLESLLQEYLGDSVPPGDIDRHARLIASCQPDPNGKIWVVENAHLVLGCRSVNGEQRFPIEGSFRDLQEMYSRILRLMAVPFPDLFPPATVKRYIQSVSDFEDRAKLPVLLAFECFHEQIFAKQIATFSTWLSRFKTSKTRTAPAPVWEDMIGEWGSAIPASVPADFHAGIRHVHSRYTDGLAGDRTAGTSKEGMRDRKQGVTDGARVRMQVWRTNASAATAGVDVAAHSGMTVTAVGTPLKIAGGGGQSTVVKRHRQACTILLG